METTLTSAQLLIGHWQTIETPPLISGSVSYFYALPYRIEIQRLDFDERPLFTRAITPPPLIVNEEGTLTQLYAEFAEEDRELAEMGLADYRQLLAGTDST